MDEKIIQDNATAAVTTEASEKETNKLFTQAEKDKEISMIINREREKFADYDTTKLAYEKLVAEKKEQELAEKSETEKLQIQLEDATSKLVSANTKLSDFEKQKVKLVVLDDQKYRDLPRAYKNMIAMNDDVEVVQQSAEKILEEFNNDMGKKVSKTFGIPNATKDETVIPITEIGSPEDIKALLRNKIARRL